MKKFKDFTKNQQTDIIAKSLGYIKHLNPNSEFKKRHYVRAVDYFRNTNPLIDRGCITYDDADALLKAVYGI
jgi:predicted RNA-binding protein with EMAP domain